ncbi:hypothetical protein D9M71_799500 [compost metagenome]
MFLYSVQIHGDHLTSASQFTIHGKVIKIGYQASTWMEQMEEELFRDWRIVYLDMHNITRKVNSGENSIIYSLEERFSNNIGN